MCCHYVLLPPQRFSSPVAHVRGLKTMGGGKEVNGRHENGAPTWWHTTFRTAEAQVENNLIPVLILVLEMEQQSPTGMTRIRAERPGFNSEQVKWLFSFPPSLLYNGGRRLFPTEIKQLGRKADSRLYKVPKLRMRGVIPSLPIRRHGLVLH
jgi:hypothetical protein